MLTDVLPQGLHVVLLGEVQNHPVNVAGVAEDSAQILSGQVCQVLGQLAGGGGFNLGDAYAVSAVKALTCDDPDACWGDHAVIGNDGAISEAELLPNQAGSGGFDVSGYGGSLV